MILVNFKLYLSLYYLNYRYYECFGAKKYAIRLIKINSIHVVCLEYLNILLILSWKKQFFNFYFAI